MRGSGGRSGVRYEVALSSLSEALQKAFIGDVGHDVQSPAQTIGCGYAPARNQAKRRAYVYRVVQEALDAPRGSPERKAEVLRAAKKWNVPTRTIYRWIADNERSGGDIDSFTRKRPSDAGKRRVWVSRQFDAAWIADGRSADELPGLGDEIDLLLCRCWASHYQRAGWEMVRRRALAMFKRDLAARGIEVADTALYVCQRRVMQFQADRRLDIREHDRKLHDDRKPRITRDATGLAPMEVVVMDVKPLDCIVKRADGTTAWPKMIAFMDWGTHRVFRYLVLLAQGEGVRQEHVTDAFKAMVAHRDWGFPQQLYRDNGSEFAHFDKIKAALELINEPGARTIVNAKPYSGASKPIESKFATLDRAVFSQIRGWAGHDRLNKKTQTVGKPPAPYPGTFKEFVAEVDIRMDEFETFVIKSGAFKGYSPQGWYKKKVDAGWGPVTISDSALEAAFAKRDKRWVDRGAMSINGKLYRHPELLAFNGQQLEIAFPYQRESIPLFNHPDYGWTGLVEDMPYLPGALDGALESSRMQTAAESALRSRRRQLVPVSRTEAIAANVTILPTRASPAPLLDVAMSAEAATFAGARIEAERNRSETAREASAARKRERERDQELSWSVLDRLGAGLNLVGSDGHEFEQRRTANLLREQGHG